MRISGIGHALFATAVAGLAMLSLVYGNFAPISGGVPAWFPWPAAGALGSGAVLLAAAAGSFFSRTARVSVRVIGAYGLVWAAARAWAVVPDPSSIGHWYGLGEALGPLLGAWTLDALLRRPHETPAATGMSGARVRRAARVLFGAACVTYGAAHFGYAALTAAMVPGWLPGRLEFAYVTGAAHTAAGLGLIVGVLPRLAATLEAIMMTLFGILVWLPSFSAQPAPEWAPTTQIRCSETFLTFLLAGSAWIVAASLRRTPDDEHRSSLRWRV